MSLHPFFRFFFVSTFLLLVAQLDAQTGGWLPGQNTGAHLSGLNPHPAVNFIPYTYTAYTPNGSPYGTTLLPFGPTHSTDSALAKGDDLSYNNLNEWRGRGPEGSSLTLNFYGKTWNSLWINNNGIISFGQQISSWNSTSLQAMSIPAVAPFWADVDTRGSQNLPTGSVWQRTTQSATELADIGNRIENAYPGAQNFHPTFATVVTWDKVSSYPADGTRVSTWQAVIASDGITTYAMFLYPPRAIWWDRGSADASDAFAAIGVTAGDGLHYTEINGSRTNAVRDVWFLSNTNPATPGTFVFDVSGTSVPLLIAGNLTLPATDGTAAATVQLSANASGHTITSTAATGSLLFNRLVFDNPANTVRFTDRAVVLANAADAINHGNLTFTDNTALVARASASLNGGVITLAKNAKLALYAAEGSTTATTLNFSLAGGMGGTLDLRGFDGAFGGLQSLDSGAGHVTNSGATSATLTLGGTGTGTFSGVMADGTGTLALRKIDSGTQILAGANTYTGGTTVSAGTLALAAPERLANTGSLTINGGTFALGAFHETVGTFSFSSGALTGTGTLTASSFTFNHAADLTLSAVLAGGRLTKTGNGTLTLTATNIYTGGTTFSGGLVSISDLAQLGSSSGALTFNGGGLQTTASLSTSRAMSFAAGGGSLDVSTGHTTTLTGPLSGAGGLTKTGDGTLVISTASTYAGDTTINAGTLVAARSGEIGTFAAGSTVIVNPGGTLQVNASDALGWGNGNARLAVNGGTVTTDGSAGQHTSLQTLTMTGGRLTDTGGNGQYFLNGTLVTHASATTAIIDSRRLELGSSSLTIADGTAAIDLDIASAVMGAGRLIKNGAGQLRLTGTNTYTGGTTLNAGTLTLGTTGTLPSVGNITINGGTLDLGQSRTHTSGAISLSGGTIVGDGATLSVESFSGSSGQISNLGALTSRQSGDTTFSGVLLTTHLILDGPGTLTLAGTNENVGASATINSGTLVLAKTGDNGGHALGHDLTINNGGTVRLAGSTGNQIHWTAPVVVNTGGTLDLNGRNESLGSFTGAGSVTNTAANTISTLTLGENTVGAFTFSGTMQNGTGTLALTKIGNATLSLTGTSTYTGATTIDSGTLVVNGSIAGSSLTRVASGATLGGGGTIGALELQSGATLTPGNSPGTLTVAGDATWHGGVAYEWEINNATGTAGIAYDLVSISGSLTILATEENKFTLSLVSLLANNTTGDVIHFNAAQNHAYTIATATGGIFGFDANAFTIDPSGFTNDLARGSWSITQSGNSLALHFTAAAIPEPSTYAVLFGALILGLTIYRKRPHR